jgi:hypothetical protein
MPIVKESRVAAGNEGRACAIEFVAVAKPSFNRFTAWLGIPMTLLTALAK